MHFDEAQLVDARRVRLPMLPGRNVARRGPQHPRRPSVLHRHATSAHRTHPPWEPRPALTVRIARNTVSCRTTASTLAALDHPHREPPLGHLAIEPPSVLLQRPARSERNA